MGLKKITRKLSKEDSRWPARDPNQAPPEHKLERYRYANLLDYSIIKRLFGVIV
jgi:hypothetical protein